MGISISSVKDDVDQQIGKANGSLTITDFNRLSRRAENRFLDWITGKVEGNILPQMYTTQKDKDFVSPFIVAFKSALTDSKITKPTDYYLYENMYALSLKEVLCDEDGSDSSCDDEEKEVSADSSNIEKDVIELLDGQRFYIRAKSKIKGLSPSLKKPIAKEIGNSFEFLPNELGGVVLEYVRYPIYAVAVSEIDPIFNTEIVGSSSTDYEWKESAREMLVWIIVDLYSNSVRENALKTFNQATAKTSP